VIFFSTLSKWTILFALFSAITSCALLRNDKVDNNFYQLQPLPSELQNKVFLESLIFEKKDKYTLLSQIETQEQTLSLGAMTFNGLPVIQAKWDSAQGLVGFDSVTFDKHMVLLILRDIQLIKWPENDIQAGLLPNYNLSTTKKDGVNWLREIKYSNKAVITIIYTEQKTVLTNVLEHYQLTIEQVNE
jgi:hypothetical protein